MLSFPEFFLEWQKAGNKNRNYKLRKEEDIPLYYKSLKYNVNIKFEFVYKLYLATGGEMPVVHFRRNLMRFIEVRDFRNWKSRMEWIGKNHSTHGYTIEKCISYYGEREGRKRWKAYCDKQALTNTFEYKKEKYGMTEEEFKAYNKSRAVTLENMIARHGEDEGKKLFESYCERQSYAGCALEYFIEKYGEEAGREKYREVNAHKVQSLENYIRKYGEEEGTERYRQFMQGQAFSKVAHNFFEEIVAKLPKELQKLDIYFNSDTRSEYYIVDKEQNTIVLYDFTIPALKFCIEFNGDYWHCNPIKYSPDDVINHHRYAKTVGELWEYDAKKNALLQDKGFDIHVIWEYDYRKDMEGTVKKCVNLILEKSKGIYGEA